MIWGPRQEIGLLIILVQSQIQRKTHKNHSQMNKIRYTSYTIGSSAGAGASAAYINIQK